MRHEQTLKLLYVFFSRYENAIICISGITCYFNTSVQCKALKLYTQNFTICHSKYFLNPFVQLLKHTVPSLEPAFCNNNTWGVIESELTTPVMLTWIGNLMEFESS